GKLLKAAGLGVGALLAGPVVAAKARATAPASRQSSSIALGRGGIGSGGLDPHKTADVRDGEVIPSIYDTLVYVDGQGKVYAGLATAWSFSGNGRVLKFKLRRGVT